MKKHLLPLMAYGAFVGLAMPSALAHPGSGIVVDPAGSVYFTHTGRGCGKIDPQGNLTYLHESRGGHWLCLDAEGGFSRTQPRHFERITPDGVKPALIFADGGSPIAVLPDGNLYYVSNDELGMAPGGLQVTRQSPGGEISIFPPDGKKTTGKLGITGLAPGPDGSLYIASPTVVWKLKMDGTFTELIHLTELKDCDVDYPDHNPNSLLPSLRGLAVDENGTILSAAVGCRAVVRISPDGKKIETVLKARPPWSPTGVAVHHGEVYVLEYTNANGSQLEGDGWRPRIRKLGRDGKVTTLATGARVDPPSPLADSFSGAKAGAEHKVGGVNLCWCPPGRFHMGSPAGEPERRADEAQVEVTLTKGFWMGKYEVTQGQWKRVVGPFPGERTAIAGDGDDFPVYWVNFDQAEGFCRKLTELAHKSGALPAKWEFRIPTEAQWEYACRAGTTTATSFGDTLNRKQANFAGTPYAFPDGTEAGPSLKRATEAGKYPANTWGLHDMHGNEFEWCRDWYHVKLPGGRDPDLYTVQGVPNRDGTYSRVRRGGAWVEEGRFCRSAFRLRYEPPRGSDHIGFRVAVIRP